jgi:hypothetical protein
VAIDGGGDEESRWSGIRVSVWKRLVAYVSPYAGGLVDGVVAESFDNEGEHGNAQRRG